MNTHCLYQDLGWISYLSFLFICSWGYGPFVTMIYQRILQYVSAMFVVVGVVVVVVVVVVWVFFIFI